MGSHLQGSDYSHYQKEQAPITSVELRGLEMKVCFQSPPHCQNSPLMQALLGRILSRKATVDRAASRLCEFYGKLLSLT